MNHDPKREAGALIAKHGFDKVEDTRMMVGGSLDPGLLRTRMAARSTDLDFDNDIVEAIRDRMKKANAKMQADSFKLDAELDD